jgi:hypothetical protein
MVNNTVEVQNAILKDARYVAFRTAALSQPLKKSPE